ncbi:polyprenyl synthetase family protein [Leifsonia virtsii]|uniref:Polyprenyl synthetase family protein n=1 Tax=Leifsonia virtsii TaxID=3035915 RepID=A0ABT8ISL2_9MICO|nr:polyprenyl synthetase family protein [Leifsonia virtsii]MDN4595789.1 polyprenyl synthetase family protein [Leifsonia virtsii]
MTQLHPQTRIPERETAGDGTAVDTAAIDADLRKVEDRLGRYFADRLHAAAGFDPAYRRLWASAREAADGGKRIRPRFLLTAHRGLGGGADDAAITAGVAYELLHTAFLLHDDVIDGDTIRRGRPNVAGAFAADATARGADAARGRRWGEAGAILAGDLLLHAAPSVLARADVDEWTRERLLDILDHGVFVTAAGELSDVALAERLGPAHPALEDVLAMTEHKTAAYSVSGPLMTGAVLAGAGEDVLTPLAEFGRLVGIAFQLGDDLLGVFGAEDVTGKSIVSDLRQGKETSLIAYARGTARWQEVAHSLGRGDLAPGEAGRLATVLEECGARRFVERLLEQHVESAVAVLATPSIPSGLAETLTGVARSCIGRIA